MKELTIGKIRGLQQIASPDGIFIMCAMDHRGSFQSMINPKNPEAVTAAEMVKRKLELCSALGKYASAVLLDPIYGAAQCISNGVLPKTTGLLVSVEATGYEGGKEHRVTRILDGWSVEKIKRMGASAVKILLYYRPDLKDLTKQQLDVIRTVAADCRKYDIPFLVEPVTYPVGDEVKNKALFTAIKPQLVIKTARDITRMPIDVLKSEFPADVHYETKRAVLKKYCEQLNEASRTPWVILSAGVDFDTFCTQVEIACKAGASGFLGGRAIWQEVVEVKSSTERVKWLSTIGADRVKKLAEIAGKYGTPWYKKLGLTAGELTEVSENWYKKY
ncbi:MAG: tagatose 1,6-diphosphate aldolase [Dehalococcoidales bacterium]|nr:tagatose 1,6-diphosphate aldolase [Dehalococcoidales bacterium]